MEKLVNYESKQEFEENKSLLQTYPDYVALTEDEKKVYLKEKEYYFLVNVSGDTNKINIRNKDGGLDNVELVNGSNKVIAPYGFEFNYLSGSKNIQSFDFQNYDTSQITDMSAMFYFCSGLTSLDLSNFDTSNVTDMVMIFNGCSGLTSLDLSNFDTSNVTDMRNMFYNNINLSTLYLDNFDTAKVTRMLDMFNNCNSLNYIRCKQAFKNWCIVNQDTIGLPTQMREGGSGTWDIVG